MRFGRRPVSSFLKEVLAKQPHRSPRHDGYQIALTWIPISAIFLEETAASIVRIDVGQIVLARNMRQRIDNGRAQRVRGRHDDQNLVTVAKICGEFDNKCGPGTRPYSFPTGQPVVLRDFTRFDPLDVAERGKEPFYVRVESVAG